MDFLRGGQGYDGMSAFGFTVVLYLAYARPEKFRPQKLKIPQQGVL